jgi:hypothetical protein
MARVAHRPLFRIARQRPPLPHLRRDSTSSGHISAGTGLTPATSAPGQARRFNICTETGLTPATSAPGLGSPRSHLRRDSAPFWPTWGLDATHAGAAFVTRLEAYGEPPTVGVPRVRIRSLSTEQSRPFWEYFEYGSVPCVPSSPPQGLESTPSNVSLPVVNGPPRPDPRSKQSMPSPLYPPNRPTKGALSPPSGFQHSGH